MRMFLLIILILINNPIFSIDENMTDSCDYELFKSILIKIDQKIDDVDKNEIITFLHCIDKCGDNSECMEFTNECLFYLLSNENKLKLVLKILEDEENLHIDKIIKIIENPINDRIHLDEIYNNIDFAIGNHKIKEELKKAIIYAKYKR